MKINDIESTTRVIIIKKNDNDEGKWKYLCCTVIVLIAFIIMIMAITGEFSNKQN
jgi:uncharacterized membrane protein